MNPLALIALAILTAPDSREGETIRIDSETVCMRNEPGHAVCIASRVTRVNVRRTNRHRMTVLSENGRTVYVYPQTIFITPSDMVSLSLNSPPNLSSL